MENTNETNIDLNKINPHALTQTLIHKHSGGWLRDISDLNSAKSNTEISINTMLTLIDETNDFTKDELKDFLVEALNGIKLFKPKK